MCARAGQLFLLLGVAYACLLTVGAALLIEPPQGHAGAAPDAPTQSGSDAVPPAVSAVKAYAVLEDEDHTAKATLGAPSHAATTAQAEVEGSSADGAVVSPEPASISELLASPVARLLVGAGIRLINISLGGGGDTPCAWFRNLCPATNELRKTTTGARIHSHRLQLRGGPCLCEWPPLRLL